MGVEKMKTPALVLPEQLIRRFERLSIPIGHVVQESDITET